MNHNLCYITDTIILQLITTDRTVHNKPHRAMLHETVKEKHLIDVANSNSHSLYRLVTQKFQE
jgi:hypothetical protein